MDQQRWENRERTVVHKRPPWDLLRLASHDLESHHILVQVFQHTQNLQSSPRERNDQRSSPAVDAGNHPSSSLISPPLTWASQTYIWSIHEDAFDVSVTTRRCCAAVGLGARQPIRGLRCVEQTEVSWKRCSVGRHHTTSLIWRNFSLWSLARSDPRR